MIVFSTDFNNFAVPRATADRARCFLATAWESASPVCGAGILSLVRREQVIFDYEQLAAPATANKAEFPIGFRCWNGKETKIEWTDRELEWKIGKSQRAKEKFKKVCKIDTKRLYLQDCVTVSWPTLRGSVQLWSKTLRRTRVKPRRGSSSRESPSVSRRQFDHLPTRDCAVLQIGGN